MRPAPAAAPVRAPDAGASGEYPAVLAVRGANQRTVDFIRASGARRIAEIGVYRGYTSLAIAEVLAGEGELHLFDFEDRVADVVDQLRDAGYTNVVGHGNSYKLSDSYNWSLMRLLRSSTGPLFDYVFLDGAHTWDIDALTFFLADRLLVVGGHLDFDDYDWSLESSPTLNPSVFPRTAERYTDEQIREHHVRLIVDLLVRRDPRYREIAPGKLFRKVGPDTREGIARPGSAEAAPRHADEEPDRIRAGERSRLETMQHDLVRERSDRLALEEAITDLDRALGRPAASPARDAEVERRRTDLYRLNLAQHIRAAVRSVTPADARVLVVSKADDALLELDGRTGMHFPRDDSGGYLGHRPRDTDEIVSRIDSLHARGAGYLVLPRFAFWWLDEYAGLEARLAGAHRRVWADAHCVVYRLGAGGEAS